MMTRRGFLQSLVYLPVAGAVLSSLGCGGGDFLSPLTVNRTTIFPNGAGVQDEADVQFTLTKRADVMATLIGPDGKTHVIRDNRTRSPDHYEIAFKGLVPVPGSDWLRIVPDGTYTLRVQAKDQSGRTIVRETQITIKNADTAAPEITNVVVAPETFSPNGDGQDDTTTLSFHLSKDAIVRVYAIDAANNFTLIQAPTKAHASEQSITWDGTVSGGDVLKDGKYTLHVEATDSAGNYTDVTAPVVIANGGIPRAEITSVKFTPHALALGMDLTVSITVKNIGTAPLKTLGPPPGTRYDTSQTYASFKDPADPNTPAYYERAGVWRVCVGWQNEAENYPLRWGFFSDIAPDKSHQVSQKVLMPGESVTVNGTITANINVPSHDVLFWAALEQGGVGFVSTQSGQTHITISH
jgi:hypothetical protein